MQLPILVTALLATSVWAEVVHRKANVTIMNNTDKPLVSVSVIHKYSSVYKETHEWGLISPGEVSSDHMVVQYNTGLGTIGQDWWLLSWYDEGLTHFHVTNPNNFRGVFDFLEDQAPAAMITAGITVAAAIATPAGFAATLGASMAAVVLAKTTSEAIFNSESTVGFKKHYLEDVDEDEPVILIVNPDNEVRINSKSDESRTVYKTDLVPLELRRNGTKSATGDAAGPGKEDARPKDDAAPEQNAGRDKGAAGSETSEGIELGEV
ncbi:hypothetical protein XA68_11672 [Ophiocordyceps unilateralis]|uniref:Up-regulated in Daf-2 domain-containing protein n=1 Tax=Ophiocordyceps unilateralis TaxID=268505 RepID=A0A2A9P214_OPHUN|nr:hypothetical protein XA68_11672 [Ophiocordyceps unilateralis]